jgi:protein-disulfide isomerase
MKKIACMAVVAMIGSGVSMRAQAAPEVSPATAEAQQAQAPTPYVVVTNPFPPVNPKNFTVESPSVDEVNQFLKSVWGYDTNRIWSVAAIKKTAAPGVSRVVVFVASKQDPTKVSRNEFYVTPDGKHAIADAVIDFGAKPFDARRTTLQAKADGPAEGAAGKDLMFVEFGDLLNGRSKEAQDTINELMKSFPEARLVFENLPAEGSSYSFRAAAEGVCVRKAKGDAAFFTYVQTMFEKEKGLTAATLGPALDASVTAAGADPKAVATCAESQSAKDDVDASVALANDVGIELAPSFVVNGRAIPTAGVAIDTLKQIIAYQAQMDGLSIHVQPTLSNIQ